MKQKLTQIINQIRTDRLHQAMLVIVIGWILVFTFLALRQHWGLKTQLDDLGNMSQPLWNSLQGRFMEYSNTGEYEAIFTSRLGGHANYIFILFIPIYALWSDPQVLLIAQVILVGMGAIPLYLLGRQFFRHESWLALVAPILFLINPSLHDAVLYDMHAIVIAVPIFFTAAYFLLNQNYRWFAAFATLFLLCKEDTALVLVMLGIWYYFYKRDWKLSGTIVLCAAAFFVINLYLLMPLFQDGRGFVLIGNRYAHLGGSVTGIITTSLTQPQLILGDLMAKELPIYLWQLGIGFGLLPYLSPATIMILPHLAINLLSNNPITSQVYGYYYTAPIVMVFGLSTLLILRSWKRDWIGLERKYLAGIILFIGLINFWWYSPMPGSRAAEWSDYRVTSTSQALEDIKAIIPDHASLTVQNNLGPHFVNRRDLVRFPFRVDESDFILILLEEPYGRITDQPRQRNFVHLAQLYPQMYYDEVVGLFEQDDLGVVYYDQGFFLFERGADQESNEEAFWDFYVRAQELFGPYEVAYPVDYHSVY